MKNNEKIKLSIGTKIILIDTGIAKIIHIFLDTFLAAYFFKITQANIFYLSIYNIVAFTTATITACFISNFIKKNSKILVYKTGIFFKTLFILIIMILGENILDYIFIIGILYGFMISMTGFPLNMIESENITKKESIKYFSMSAIISEMVSIFVPILLGSYISLNSYKTTAIFIFIFSLIEFLVVLKLENKNSQVEKVQLKNFYRDNKHDIYLKKLYVIEFFKGFTRNGVMGLIVTLLIIYNTKNELSLGAFTSLFSIITIITMFIFGKVYSKKIKNRLLATCFFGLLIGCILIITKTSMTTILIYEVFYYIFMNIIMKITQINLFNYSNEDMFATIYNTEYFLIREIFLNTGRILGYASLLLLVGIPNNMANLNIMFFLILFSIGLMVYTSSTLEKVNDSL